VHALRLPRHSLCQVTARPEPASDLPRFARQPVLEGNLLSANLDVKNPNASGATEHRPPEEIVEELLSTEARIAAVVAEVRQELGRAGR